MIKFETLLKKEKCQVIESVARLIKEEQLNDKELELLPIKLADEQEEHYRCCVYKERAIFEQKIKLALGCSADEEKIEFVNIIKDKQVVHVIPAACDSCPINKYTITEACRGCVEHKCMEICPAKAIVRVNGRAYINQNLCKECGLCKQVCPFHAVSEVLRPCKQVCPTKALDIDPKYRKATIKEENCINCGACITACPFGTISDKSCITRVVEKLINTQKKVYAVVAPAIAGQFSGKITMNHIKAAVKKLGFEDMIEASLGADLVTITEAKEFIERLENNEKFMTTSCCPAFVNYIKKEFPMLEENISSTVSPMIATARMIKTKYPNSKVVFIGPCVAKKNEIKREELLGDVDNVMTFEELIALFMAFDIDVENLEPEELNDGTLFGRNFAFAGGVADSVAQYIKEKNLDIEFNPVKVSGLEQVKKALNLAKLGKLDGNFIEGMMCEGGCIAGPANICSVKKARVNLTNFNKTSEKKEITNNKKALEFCEMHMHC